MGVDIAFAAEVRKKDKWQPLIWYSKTDKEDNDGEYGKIIKNGLETHYCIWAGRAYHYTDAIEDMDNYCGFPEDMSDELKALIADDEFASGGYFMFSRLVKYINNAEKKMLADLLQSRDYQLVKHVQRIEKKVLGKPVKDKIKTTYLENYSMKQIYDEYIDDIWSWMKIRNVISYLVEEMASYSRDEDIRVIYFYC